MRLASIFRATPITVLLLAASWKAAAQVEPESTESPRWSYEIRGGYIDPDLDLFETFYGDDRESYYGLTGSYRFRSWLEIGGEYSQMRAKGVGILTTSQALGGSVEYRLSPAQIYSNFIFQRSSSQRVVPYVGLGLTVAKYEQDVELQGSTEGTTDLGFSESMGARPRCSCATNYRTRRWSSQTPEKSPRYAPRRTASSSPTMTPTWRN